MAGISRSVTLVLAYLIKCKGMDYHTAFNHVKSRRKIVPLDVIQINPNDGFIQQLKSF
jgi:protein-tyrosine phosphatase